MTSANDGNGGAIPGRVLLRHQSGPKAGRVDDIPFKRTDMIKLGRDPSATVTFESEPDDLVGLEHAMIYRDQHDLRRFILADQGCATGTYINHQRVFTESVITAGDIVHLGAGGPWFLFDLDPHPETETSQSQPVVGLTPPTPENSPAAESSEPAPTSDEQEFGPSPAEPTTTGFPMVALVVLVIIVVIAIISAIVLARKRYGGRDLSSLGGSYVVASTDYREPSAGLTPDAETRPR